MSKLDQLINELCPNGVEYKTIGDVCTIKKGVQINKDKLRNEGKYPVINGGINPSGYWDEYNFKGGLITISQGGASAGYVNYTNTPFWAGAHCYVVENCEEYLNYMYLYHFIKMQQKTFMKRQYGAGIPSLGLKSIDSISIPLPPLPVQEEIVRILNKFKKLTEELTEELTARKRQYEYYRNALLSKNTNKKSLKQIALSSRSGGTPLKSNKAYYDDGTIPWLRTQEVVFNEINKTDCFITELAVQETSAKWIPANCVIVAISGASAGRCAINKIPLTTNQHCLAIEINPEVALYKYVFYCVCNQYKDLIAKKEGARGDLNSLRILGLEIPIPYPEDKEKSLAEQQRIVDTLDCFDRLCNDISEGLPAEIEARQKQYEYYRDKLLTFKKKEATENE
jgi:type I restriction enzyme S subunit